jgi:hypothetical protein
MGGSKGWAEWAMTHPEISENSSLALQQYTLRFSSLVARGGYKGWPGGPQPTLRF